MGDTNFAYLLNQRHCFVILVHLIMKAHLALAESEKVKRSENRKKKFQVKQLFAALQSLAFETFPFRKLSSVILHQLDVE